MKQLIIVRHAKSDWSQLGKTIEKDHDRPLNRRGLKNAPAMGAHLRHEGMKPDLILSSTAERAQSTAKLIANELEKAPDVTLEPKLYACTCEIWLQSIAALDDEHNCVMMVGHNPEISATTGVLTQMPIEMITCAVVSMKFDVKHWADVVKTPCSVWHHFTPKTIKDAP